MAESIGIKNKLNLSRRENGSTNRNNNSFNGFTDF
jgi:hypothetical protein